VVAVIKTTLESLKVKVADIIDDAAKKQKDLEGRMTNLKQAITEFEKEIQQRKDEIARLEADHAETTAVKGRLELAERAQKAQSQSGAHKPAPQGSGVLGAKA
jgi:DNA anti-recombination protein RmuC